MMSSPWGLNDPTEGSRVSITDPWDRTASEFGWQSTGSITYNTSRGNNAIAQSNPSGGTSYLNNYRPVRKSYVRTACETHTDFVHQHLEQCHPELRVPLH